MSQQSIRLLFAIALTGLISGMPTSVGIEIGQ